MNEARRKEIEKAFTETDDAYLLDFDFWQEMKTYSEIVDHVFNYVEKKVDEKQKSNVLVKLLKNTSKFNTTFQMLKINNFDGPENITLIFENIDWVIALIAAERRHKDKEREENKELLKKDPEALIGTRFFVNPMNCIRNAQTIKECFSYLEKESLLNDERMLNFASNIHHVSPVRNSILENPEFVGQTDKYLHLIYKNSWSKPLIDLLALMQKHNLLTSKNLDAVFSKEIKALSCLEIYELFKITKDDEDNWGFLLNQEIFDAFSENINHMDKVQALLDKLFELENAQENSPIPLSGGVNFDKLLSPQNTALIYNCAEYALFLKNILVFCGHHGITLSKTQINLLKENKKMLEHIGEALTHKHITTVVEYSMIFRQTEENAKIVRQYGIDLKNMFNEVLESPKAARIIVYKFIEKNSPKSIDHETKKDFRERYQYGRCWGEMWRGWDMVNLEGKEVSKPPIEIMEKIISDTGNSIDEMTNSAIMERCLKKFS